MKSNYNLKLFGVTIALQTNYAKVENNIIYFCSLFGVATQFYVYFIQAAAMDTQFEFLTAV